MGIEYYEFGKIIIDGIIYKKDLVLYPDKVETNWWRDASHLVRIEDLQNILNTLPQVLLIGTGAYGEAKIDNSVKNTCDSKGIKLIVEDTQKACKTYNELKKQNLNIVTALHL